MKFILNVLAIFTFAFSTILFSSCNGCNGCNDDKSVWSNFKPLNEIDKYIDSYYDASLGEAANPKTGQPAIYVDFSTGVSQAYKPSSINQQIIKKIASIYDTSISKWYTLSNDKINPLNIESNLMYQKVIDQNSFNGIMAPIGDALKDITNSNNDAILITDFEGYTNNKKEDLSPFQKTYFTDWLKKGNSITFLYTNGYDEINGKNHSVKHIYYTVFNHGKINNNSIIFRLKNALDGDKIIYTEFHLNNCPYTITNNYGGKQLTGIINNSLSKYVNYSNNANLDKQLPYEVIGINKAWNDNLDKYIKNIIKNEAGEFMGKLYLDAHDQSSYKLNKIDVKLYDVTKDYEFYARCLEAKNHLPKLAKDKGKNDVWSKVSLKDQIVNACYEKNTINLKKEWIYAMSKNPNDSKLIDEVFDYDKIIFSNHLKNSLNKVELITKFHNNYKLKNIENPNALWRIDFIIDDVTFNSSNLQLSDFQWQSIINPNETNNSLSESIKNTLLDPSVNPKGKIIYSYYIKLNNI